VEFLAAYLPSALLWSSETVLRTARRVSEESHSGFALQPLTEIRKGKIQKAVDRLQVYGMRSFRLAIHRQPVWRSIVPSEWRLKAALLSLAGRGGLCLGCTLSGG
jgi:hypothetical protein